MRNLADLITEVLRQTGVRRWGLRAVLNGRDDEIIDLVEGGNVFKTLFS